MDAKTHWEKVYTTKEPEAVSWYRAHLETSLALIERAAHSRSASIIDIGAGESTLVDDLLARGYENITILDVSQRLGLLAEQVKWIVADITQAQLESFAYDVWHDRAVFHFLTSIEQRAAYVRNVAKAVKPGGHVIVSTFGPEGRPAQECLLVPPAKLSDLTVFPKAL
jgi:2-polyprenyl-3-methyl-5-hydroxy-6-metoxy-1,4-benzoquinol methylase